MELVKAAATRCDLLWMIDGSVSDMRDMSSLLNRFGPVVDIDGLTVEQLLGELSPPYAPDGIVTYLDSNMTTFARVAQALNLPFHSVDTAEALTNKAIQRRVLAAKGIPSPRCIELDVRLSDDEVGNLVADISWPNVLKPRSAQGSRYTFLVNDIDHLNYYLLALGADRPPMVLESYLADDTDRSHSPFAAYVSVESIAAQGTVSHLALTGRFPMADNFRETGFFIPASLDDGDARAALELASTAINALGVTTGCLHTEIKFTSEGPRIIEVNGRVGGGVPEMLERSAGVGLLDLTLRVALGETVVIDDLVPTSHIGYRFFLQPPALSGTVGETSGIDMVSEHPSVDQITVHQGPGSELNWRDGSRNHIVAVVGSAADYRELEEVNRLLRDKVVVTYSNVNYN